jgi:hypothetical protein
MNERINELFGQAMDQSIPETWTTLTHSQLSILKDKFAELLIKECIERGNDLAKHYINNHSEQEQVFLLASIADYSNEIKKHFGVEE